MTPDEMRQAIERTVVDTLRLIHFDGNVCGTHDSGACSVCYGPSPLDATEIAEHLVPAIVDVVAPALEAAERQAEHAMRDADRLSALAHQRRVERDEARAALEVAESWRDHNAESAECFREQRDAALAENERLRRLFNGALKRGGEYQAAVERVRALCDASIPGRLFTVRVIRAALDGQEPTRGA